MATQEGWTERNAIQFRMTQLETERESIRNEFQGLLNRLHELDRIEAQEKRKQGQQSYFFGIPTETREMETVQDSVSSINSEPIHEEIQNVEEIRLSEVASTIEIEPLSEQAIVEAKKNETTPLLEEKEMKNEVDKEDEEEIVVSKKASLIPQKQRRASDKEKKKAIITELKRKKRLSTKQIREFSINQGFAVSALNKLMSDIVKETPQILRLGRGLYDWDDTKE